MYDHYGVGLFRNSFVPRPSRSGNETMEACKRARGCAIARFNTMFIKIPVSRELR